VWETGVTDRKSSGVSIALEGKKTHQLGDSDLIGAMRRDELFAFIEFIERFRHVAWNEARGLGIDSALRKSWTEEVLHDCALALTRESAKIPFNVPGYVIVSVRRKFFAERRKDADTSRVLGSYADELRESDQAQHIELSEPLLRLAKSLASEITEEEEALLEWKRRKLGYSQAAAWLGVKRDTVAHRTLRLTARLQKAAEKFLESLNDEEIQIVRRFIDGVRRGDK
jgi:DNA-directed RNA polymerase specialized sigma24 family protein